MPVEPFKKKDPSPLAPIAKGDVDDPNREQYPQHAMYHDPFTGPARGPEDKNYWCVDCNATTYFSPMGGDRWQCKSCGRPAEFTSAPMPQGGEPKPPDPEPWLPYNRRPRPGQQQILPGMNRQDVPEGLDRFTIEGLIRSLGGGKDADGLVEDLW